MSIKRFTRSSIVDNYGYQSMLAGNTPTVYAYDSIQTVTVGSGGQATISFTSIPATYTHLQIRAIVRTARASTADYLYVRYNSDTATNYSAHEVAGDGTSASAYGLSTVARMQIDTFPAASATAGMFGAFVLDLLDYANTNKYKTVRAIGGNDNNSTQGTVAFRSNNWRSTSAVSSISLAGNFAQYSSFALYGIKG